MTPRPAWDLLARWVIQVFGLLRPDFVPAPATVSVERRGRLRASYVHERALEQRDEQRRAYAFDPFLPERIRSGRPPSRLEGRLGRANARKVARLTWLTW